MLNELWMKAAVRIQWWLTYLIWSKYLGHRLDPRVSSMYRLRLIRRSHTSPRTIGFDMRPSYCPPPMSGGACEMGLWAGSHNAPISALYRQSPDSVRRNQAIVDTSLWPRGARSDVGSSVFRSILHPRISRAKVLSGRAGYWEQAEEMRMMIQFFNDSWKGWPEHQHENKLRVYPRHSRRWQSKTTHLWQYWSTHIVRCYQVSMSLLILNAWCNEMCTKFSILLKVLFYPCGPQLLLAWWDFLGSD